MKRITARSLTPLGVAAVGTSGLTIAFVLGWALGSDSRLRAGAVSSGVPDEAFWRVGVELASGVRPVEAAPRPARRRAEERVELEVEPGPEAGVATRGELLERRMERSLSSRPRDPNLASLEREPPVEPRIVTTGPVLESPNFKGYQVQDESGDWRREGPWEAYHDNGELHELGAYRNDGEHGPWRWWYESGARMAEGTFDEGEREGAWTFWYENGALQMQGRYEDDEGVGTWTYYYENGRPRAEGEMAAGELVGYWTVWNEDGTVDSRRSGDRGGVGGGQD